MERFHGNSLGHAYLQDGWIGPDKRTTTGSRFGRFHPYSGTIYNDGSQESLAARSRMASNTLPPAKYGIPTSQFLPHTSVFETEMLSCTGAMLMQALMQQDALAYGTTSVASTTTSLSTLQQLCYSDSTPRTSRQCSSALKKQQSHPFYRRQRKEPAEGMTRTRDKYRVVYTDKQRKGLEAEYRTNKFITMQRKLELTKELNLSDRQIKIWFQNRRAKERRDSRKNSDDSLSDSDKTSEEDNSLVHGLEGVANNMYSMTPGYNTKNQVQINERGMTSFSTEQCSFMSPEDNYTTSDTHTTSDCAQSTIGEPLKQAMLPRLSVSPSEWNQTLNNGYSGYNFTVNVSPINMDFGFGQRL